MQAVAFTQTGPPDVLRILEVPDPNPGPGQVRIQVKVSGVDQVINYQRDNFAQAMLDLTGGRGVDVVFDAVGAATVAGPGLVCSMPIVSRTCGRAAWPIWYR